VIAALEAFKSALAGTLISSRILWRDRIRDVIEVPALFLGGIRDVIEVAVGHLMLTETSGRWAAGSVPVC
jgi:hypothetical protein